VASQQIVELVRKALVMLADARSPRMIWRDEIDASDHDAVVTAARDRARQSYS
jgi:hypothetical protein